MVISDSYCFPFADSLHEEIWYVFYSYTDIFGRKIVVEGKAGGTTGDTRTTIYHDPFPKQQESKPLNTTTG